MRKQVLVALVLVVVVAAAIVWVRVGRSGARDAEGFATDSVMVAPGDATRPDAAHPGEIPSDLETWIKATLWRNGLLASRGDSFLTTAPYGRTRLWVDSTGPKPVWTVDFTDLDIAVLGPDDRNGERSVADDYEVRLRVDGTRLCAEADRKVSHPGWSVLGGQAFRCGPDDARKLVRTWFVERFRREPGASEFSMDGGKAVLDISCRGRDSVAELGRLRSVEFSRLKVSGCTLDGSDAMLLADLSVERMELVDVKTEVLPFLDAKVSQRLSVRGGTVRWVDLPLTCPPGRKDCDFAERVLTPGLSVELRDIPLCDPGSVANFPKLGVVLADLRCREVPYAMLARRDSLQAQWKRLRDQFLERLQEGSYDTISQEARPRTPDAKPTWSYVVTTFSSDQCGAEDYPRYDSPMEERGSQGRIGDEYFEGPGIRASYKGRPIRAGMTRQELVALLGRPTVDPKEAALEGFLAWTVVGSCDVDRANLVAHFDAQGKLDAWMDQTEAECGGC